MRATIDDELVIHAPTFGGASKVSEIRANPSVHLAFGQTTSEQPGSYFRIDGRATISADPSDRRLAWNDRLNRWFDGLDDLRYLVVRIVTERLVAFLIGGGLSAQTWTANAASIPD